MPNKKNKIPNFLKLADRLIDSALRYSSVEALSFFKDSFQKQGFTDTAFTAWPSRKEDSRVGGAILVQTGNLRDSLQILSRSKLRLEFGTHAPYAKLHNEGGTFNITLTPRSRKYFWYMYKATRQERWKWMAISKKNQLRVKMPKRQFIGHSENLMKDLNNWWVRKIESEFKQHINHF